MRVAKLVLLVGMFTSSACSSKYTTSDRQSCELLAQADCSKIDQCVHNGVVNRYGDIATCETLLTAQCKARFEATNTGAHSSELVSCVSALPAASCASFVSNTLDACEPQPGLGALGSACAFSTQCTSSYCAVATNGTCGTCAAFSTAGEDCSAHDCSPGFKCVAATMTCEPPSGPGDPCDEQGPCAFALSCVTPAGATSGTCVASGETVGVLCDPKHETAPGCDGLNGLVCSASTNKCITLTYATAGQPCGNVSGTTVECESKSSCFGASGTTPGTCVAFAAPGAVCNTSTGPDCAPPAICVTGSPNNTAGTCTLLDASACK